MPRSNERRYYAQDAADSITPAARPHDGPRQTGTVRSVRADKGFGFISSDHGRGREFFFHRSSCDDFDRLTEGSTVSFVPGRGPKGPRAEHVSIVT
jgi:cold shock protein